MNILQVLSSLDIGGAERTVVDLSIELKHRGHNVSVCTLRHSGPFEAPLSKAGISVTALDKPDGFNYGIVRRLSTLMQANAIQIVHTHNPHVHTYGLLAAKRAKVRVVLCTLHGLRLGQIGKRETIFGALMPFTDAVVSVSEHTRRIFARHPSLVGRDVTLIPNGVQLQRFEGIAARKASAKIVFGCVARLVHVKDHQTLLRAFQLAATRFPDIRLKILGDGPLRCELERLRDDLGLKSKAMFHGSDLDVASFLEEIDVFVLSSLSEGLPSAVLEALAAGRPVIATSVGGVPEILDGQGCGWLVPPASVDALANAMTEAISCERLCSMGLRGRSSVAIEYSLETMCSRHEALYERLLGR